MKVLFVNHIPEHFIKDREPLGIMSLSAVLKEAGHEVRFCSPQINKIESILQEFPAGIIGYSITTGYHNFYLQFNNKLRKRNKNIFSVFGGPHTTFTPDFINESIFIDAVCLGEADYAFVEFVEKLESQGAYHLTPNFYVRRDGKIYKNLVRNLVDDLDRLPFPDRELIYSSCRLAAESKIKNFMTMRGCPYSCSYCFNASYHKLYNSKGKMLRRRSVKNVLNELDDVASKYPLELVYFRDDNFLLFPDWVEDFCDQYKRSLNLPFVCAGRLDLVTDKIASTLKRAACVSIEAGIEAGNEYIRSEVLKRNISRSKMVEGAKILRLHGIKIMAENLIGVPESTIKNELETYSLNKECSVFYINSSILQPYFGTEIYERSMKLGLFKDDLNRISPSAYLKGMSLLNLKHRKQRERLNKIIAISGKLNLPVWLIRILIYLPLLSVYSLIRVIFKGYSGSKLYPCQYTLKEKIKIFFQLFRQHHLFSSAEDQ